MMHLKKEMKINPYKDTSQGNWRTPKTNLKGSRREKQTAYQDSMIRLTMALMANTGGQK